MQPKHFLNAAVLAAGVILTCVAAWEMYWRSQGFIPTYNDDEALWAEKRDDVYQPANSTTVFIGSSRIKYDLDLATWESVTGEKPVQLAFIGSSPRRVLRHLANDKNFKGKLVIDVAEALFFGRGGGPDRAPYKAIEFYNDYTPSQKASTCINFMLEKHLVFLEKNRFSLNQFLLEIPLPERKGTRNPPVFVKEFDWTSKDRQTYMAPKFLADTNLQIRQQKKWTMSRVPSITGDTLIAVFKEVKTNIDKIKSRGGQVIFVRTPVSGPMLENGNKFYPRQQYWDALLQYSNTPGIHFLDYPETSNYICPEWSHLSTKDAIDYTKHLAKALEQKGWFSEKR